MRPACALKFRFDDAVLMTFCLNYISVADIYADVVDSLGVVLVVRLIDELPDVSGEVRDRSLKGRI